METCVDHHPATGSMAFYDAAGRYRNLDELDFSKHDELYYLERYTPVPFLDDAAPSDLGRETYEKPATRCVKVWANRLFTESIVRNRGRHVLYLDGPDLNTTKNLMNGPATNLHLPNPFSYDAICAAIRSSFTVTAVSNELFSECPNYRHVQLRAVFTIDRPGREPVTVHVYRQPVYVTIQMLRLIDIVFDGVWLDYTGTFEGAAAKLHFPTYDLYHLFSAKMLSSGAVLMLTFSHRDGRTCRNTVPSAVYTLADRHGYAVENTCPLDMDQDMAVACEGLTDFNQTCHPIKTFNCQSPDRSQFPFGRHADEEPLYDVTEANRRLASEPSPIGFSYGTMTNFIFQVRNENIENTRNTEPEYMVDRITNHKVDPVLGLVYETYWVGYQDPTWQPERDFWVDGIPTEALLRYNDKVKSQSDSDSESDYRIKSQSGSESDYRIKPKFASEMKRAGKKRSKSRSKSRSGQSGTKKGSRMYRVEGIVGHEMVDDRLMFLTKWAGYDRLTWQPESDFITRHGTNEQYLHYISANGL